MSRATEDLLDQLHAMTAEDMLDTLQKYRDGKVRDKDGLPLPLPASFVTAVAKFLKDNGVDRPRRQGDTIDKLAGVLPDVSSVIQFPGSR